MVLISVDFPAPLSPSRPSTSPFFRCRLTSRSAVTGPKLLAMCSTRKTSSGAATGATMCSAGIAWSAKARLPSRAPDVDVDPHGEQDRETEVEDEVVGVHAFDREAVLEDAQEEGADQRSDDGARAAREQRAADDRGGDRVEQDRVGGRGVGRDRTGAHGLEDAAEAGEGAADHEVADEDPPHPDACLR